MVFMDENHAEQWSEAIDRAGALKNDDTVNSYFGASLFIITGVPGLYSRVKNHIHNSWIDFEAILKEGLSLGENILVSLAGNFYNGGFFDRYTPEDIINYCDRKNVELVARALWLRKQIVNINTIYN